MKFAPYTSGRLRKLKVGITSDPAHDTTTSLQVLGGANIVGIEKLDLTARVSDPLSIIT